VAKERPQRKQMRIGVLGAVEQLQDRSDEELLRETRHRAAARVILGERAAQRMDSKQARAYFNEAMAGAHPQERPMLRQITKAALAQAERRPDELRDAMEKMGQAPPSNRQLMALRFMGLVFPPPGSSFALRARGVAILMLIVLVLLAVGFGLAKLVALPFGGVGTIGAILLGLLIVVAILGVLTLLGRRRQARAQAAARGGA
jgi:hypothetical protein